VECHTKVHHARLREQPHQSATPSDTAFVLHDVAGSVSKLYVVVTTGVVTSGVESVSSLGMRIHRTG
jgi:hypothetical protein